jgi:hypothetical protein
MSGQLLEGSEEKLLPTSVTAVGVSDEIQMDHPLLSRQRISSVSRQIQQRRHHDGPKDAADSNYGIQYLTDTENIL